jgi:hypothetical protein
VAEEQPHGQHEGQERSAEEDRGDRDDARAEQQCHDPRTRGHEPLGDERDRDELQPLVGLEGRVRGRGEQVDEHRRAKQRDGGDGLLAPTAEGECGDGNRQRGQGEPELQDERVQEVAVEQPALSRHLARQDLVLAEVGERGNDRDQ